MITLFPSTEIFGEKTKIQGQSSISETQEKLSSIQEEEKEILKVLFAQIQEIEALERESNNILLEIEAMKEDIKVVEKRILQAQQGYDHNLTALKTLLQSYQRLGAGSYLNIILESESVQDLLKRVNILQDLSKNSKELLDTIEKDKKNLEIEKDKLDVKLNELVEIQNILKDNLLKKQKAVKQNEDYLESLAEDRDSYEEKLKDLALIMDELKFLMKEFTVEFSKIVENGNFPSSAVEESFTLKGIKGIIKEETFNNIIKEQTNLPFIEFKFKDNILEMNVPDKQLYLSGNFTIKDHNILVFQPEEGTFFDMVLEKGTINELFKEGDFLLDLEPIIGNSIIKSVTIKNGYLEMIVSIKLF